MSQLEHFSVPAACLALCAAASGQTPLHVDDDATGANDGSSWEDAFVDLQDALAATSAGREIWVATGTYRPSDSGNRLESFRPGPSTLLYGGFDGTETSLAERAGLFHLTVLDGDLARDDGPGFANRGDNSEHVFVMDVSLGSRIDGFAIRGGNAVDQGGGGWYATVLSCSRARNCTFVDNEGVRGGAVWGGGFSLDSFRDCRFLENRGEEGGAVWSGSGPVTLSFDRCLFVGNAATLVGGGAVAGWADVTNSLLSGNSADGTSQGGGAFLGAGTLLQSTVYANRALGGALVGGVSGWTAVRGSILWGNRNDRGSIAAAQFQHASLGWGGIDASCVQGWAPALGGTGILSSDPEFLHPLGPDGVAGTFDDDLRLGLLSPCVDRRPAVSWWKHDLLGKRRNVDARSCDTGVMDLGAHERPGAGEAPRFCPATPSSLGVPATLRAPCAADPNGGLIAVSAGPVPGHVGLLLLGSARDETPFGNGVGCLAGDVRRLEPVLALGGTLLLSFDPAQVPGGALPVGTTWNLQALYADEAAGAAGFNLTDAVALTLLP